jgi:hypothetical protein
MAGELPGSGMDVIGLLVRSDLRRRWRSWLVLVLLVAVVAGVAMAAVAGSRRTSTAMDRFVDFHRPTNAYVEGSFSKEDIEAIEGVEAAVGGDYFLLVPVDGAGRPHPEQLGQVSPFSFDDPRSFVDVDRPIIVDGHLPDPARAEEVMVDEEMAERYDLAAGDTIRMQAYTLDQLEQLYEGIGSVPPDGEVLDLRVTAIARAPQDVVPKQQVPDVVYLGSAEVLLGPAFHEAHWRKDIPSLGVLFADLGEVGDLGFDLRVDFEATTREELVEAVRALDDDAPVDFSGSDAVRARSEAQRSIRVQAVMLLALGVVVAVGGFVLVAQAVRRQLEVDRANQRSVLALGAGRRTAVAVAATKGALLAAAAMPVAAVVAVALSPLTPVGHARRAEVDPGVDVDGLVLLAGCALTGLLLVGFVVAVAWREAAVARRRRRHVPSVVTGASDWAGQAGFSPPVVAGIRAALLGTGRWTAVVTVFVAVAGIVGALGYAASESKLANDPALWGWTFDAALGDGNDLGVEERASRTLTDNPMVESYALRYEIESVEAQAGDRSTQVVASAIDEVEGSIDLRMLTGRPPVDDDEVAVGAATARQLGVGVDDEIVLQGEEEPQAFTVTGFVVMHLGLSSDRIGEGMVLSRDGLARVAELDAPAFALVEYADDVDPDEVYAALREDWGNTVLEPVRAIDVDQLHAVRHLPVWFSGLLAVVAVATLAFVLVVTIRRRRRDLALLRTLGFEVRDVRTTVLVQALTLVLPAAVVGSVIGLAGGRLAWALTAEGLGAPEAQATPVLALGAVVVGAAAVAVLVSSVPGRLAARARPALVLRTE